MTTRPSEATPAADAGSAPATEMKTAVAAARPYEVMEELMGRLAVLDLEFWLIRGAIRALKEGDPDHFTPAGVPVIAALERITGLRKISAARRDLAWRQHLEAQYPPPPGAPPQD